MKRSIKREYAEGLLAQGCNQLNTVMMTAQKKSKKPLILIMQNKYCCN
ncbi:hypothetical protein [Niallia sp. NCCP-28]|nr:hypothetical protein [Niallia sp. NCCP-28]